MNATTVRKRGRGKCGSFEAVVETFEPEQPEAATRQVSGQAADDFIPTNFRADILAAGLRYRWNAPSSGTVRGYELRHGIAMPTWKPAQPRPVSIASDTLQHQVTGRHKRIRVLGASEGPG